MSSLRNVSLPVINTAARVVGYTWIYGRPRLGENGGERNNAIVLPLLSRHVSRRWTDSSYNIAGEVNCIVLAATLPCLCLDAPWPHLGVRGDGASKAGRRAMEFHHRRCS